MTTGFRYVLNTLVLAGAYIAAAKFGIEQPVAHGVITPVWAPTGIAIAFLFAFGPRYWPGVAIGAFVANVTSDVSVLVAGGICVGNTLEALVATFLLNKARVAQNLARARDVIAFVGLAAIVSTTLSASVGVSVLLRDGVVTESDFWQEWLLWWFGDLIGALLVAPLILAWVGAIRRRRSPGPVLEGVFLSALLIGASIVVFIGGNWKYPYLLFPLLAWAALRFRQVGAATAIFIVGAIATWGTVHGSIPIGGATETESVQILQALIAVVAVSVFLIAATMNERDAASADARTAFSHLQEAQGLAHLGSWEWDLPSGSVTWSDELFRIHGCEPGEFSVTFDKALEFIVDEDQPRIQENVGSGLAAGHDNELPVIQYRVLRPDGETRTLRGWGVIQFEGGDPIRMVGTVQDITEAVEAERALESALAREREAAEQLRDLDATKNMFISAVAHDLRTPLSTIGGFAAMLHQRYDKFPKVEALDIIARIESNAERASRMLTNLLDVDRLERGVIDTSPTEIDLSDVALRVVHGLEHEREVQVDPAHVTAWADDVLIERIIENLLVNAIRYTPPDSPVLIRFERMPDGAVISVEDSGPGVPDELKGSIFHAFQRGESELATGTGLGLFLVSQFAELHRGRAWVEDRAEGGAAFKVFLPKPPGDLV
jgi:signal transduction histidine kinase